MKKPRRPRLLVGAVNAYAATLRKQRAEAAVAALVDRLRRNLEHITPAGHA